MWIVSEQVKCEMIGRCVAIANLGYASDFNIFCFTKLDYRVSFISSTLKAFRVCQTMKYLITTVKHNISSVVLHRYISCCYICIKMVCENSRFQINILTLHSIIHLIIMLKYIRPLWMSMFLYRLRILNFEFQHFVNNRWWIHALPFFITYCRNLTLF